MSLLIKNAILNGKESDILMDGGLIKRISQDINDVADETIDASGMAIYPPFYNCHCHAAMTILRGYADDMLLQDWLSKYIWPKEATLTQNDIYWGSKLAILEMIKSGTVFFADMYWMEWQTEKAVEEMGIRACLAPTVMSRQAKDEHDEIFGKFETWKPSTKRILKSIAPHAIYTCDTPLLERCADLVNNNDDIFCQIHVAETQREVEECRRQNKGLTPVEYLNEVGLLGNKTIAAHMIHLTEKDVEIAAETKTVSVHNPCSNMKLSSGTMNIPLLKKKNCRLALGTDGVSSNNNLDMMEEMKIAALLAKLNCGPEKLSAADAFSLATEKGAEAFGLKAGKIEEGYLADAMLVDMNNERMTPDWNSISNLVYSANSSIIDTLICDGNIVMEHRNVPGEEEIVAKVSEICRH